MSDTKIIEVTIPSANTAAEWNQNITEGAEKAGVELPKPGAIRITEAPDADKKDDETIYRSTLKVGDKEMVFEGKDAADVLKQYSAAVEAAQLASAPAPAAAKVEEPKPKFTDAELFDIQVGLQKGDTAVLENFIVKSGVIDKYLESKGIKVDELKNAATERQSDKIADKWKDATDAFAAKVKAGESDYPGGEQNTYLMGLMLAELGLRDKPSVESFEKAYAVLKERKLVFPVAAKTSEETAAEAAAAAAAGKKKDPPSSTAVGSHGGKQDLTQQQGAPTGKVELDTTKLSIREAAESWNELIRRGYKPEQIVVKQ
jgi:hypothetical protein